MEELSDATAKVLEFCPSLDDASAHRRHELMERCIGTDPLPPNKSMGAQTNLSSNVETQTDMIHTMAKLSAADERKLANWLQQICPRVEDELQHPTPLLDSGDQLLLTLSEELKIEPYQKLNVNSSNGDCEYTVGTATWLSVHTNDAPVLVLSAVPAAANDWSETVHQYLKVFQPKRASMGNYVVYTEVASVPTKVVKTLSTNSFNKSIFAGSTLDGDIYVWQYEDKQSAATTATAAASSDGGTVTITELHCCVSPQGLAVAMDWTNEQSLLTAHASGWIIQWHVPTQQQQQQQHQMRPDWHYELKPSINGAAVAGNEISAIVCIGHNEFVVGTQDGGVYHCWSAGNHMLTGGVGTKAHFEIVALRKHHFMIATLLKAGLTNSVCGGSGGDKSCVLVISCDLSGVVYYHDLRHAADDDDGGGDNAQNNQRRCANVAQIPLPFKNAIACSRDALVIYAPGNDGALECYRIRDGQHTSIKGALRGKGNFIKCSDNGHWIITGLYEDEFQIFYADYDT